MAGAGQMEADMESRRLDGVRRYEILDTPPEETFDRIVAITARRFDTPISAISIVDSDRIWFKSRYGLDVAALNRDLGLCATTVLGGEPRILSDARLDPVARTNPLVAGDFNLRFYAGAPLISPDGLNIGTLCAIDQKPHEVSEALVRDLQDMAAIVIDQLEMRRAARAAVAQEQLLAREVDHRVMNSLQLISGLLSVQSRRAGESAEARRQLEIAAARVAAISRVHRHCYSTDREAGSGLAFIRRLCADLADIFGCDMIVDGDDNAAALPDLQTIGVLINELVTNAVKYGAGGVAVAYRVDAHNQCIEVADNGPGLPGDFDPKAHSGLGMKVILSLTRQLKGEFCWENCADGHGARFRVTFPG